MIELFLRHWEHCLIVLEGLLLGYIFKNMPLAIMIIVVVIVVELFSFHYYIEF